MRVPFALTWAATLLVAPTIAFAQDTAAADLPSCERAAASFVDDRTAASGPKDLAAGDFAAVLDNGSYLAPCNVPDSMTVKVCVAVQNGKAVGLTVATEPESSDVASCVRSEVAALEFPSHPKLDVARTTFSPPPPDPPRTSASSRDGAAMSGPPPVEPKKSGCGCALPGAPSGGAWAALALLVGGFFLRRSSARHVAAHSGENTIG